MTKDEAIALVCGPSGRPVDLAKAIGITVQAVSQWPQVLTPKLEDRVLAAHIRKAQSKPKRSRKKGITA